MKYCRHYEIIVFENNCFTFQCLVYVQHKIGTVIPHLLLLEFYC
jgi:hypothetical protein